MKQDLTGKPQLLKEINIGLIKDALGKHGSATRVELAAITKISQPTVNLLIRELLADGTIISLGTLASTGGRPAKSYALNQKKSSVALVTATQFCFEICITDMELATEATFSIPRNEAFSYTEQLKQELTQLMKEYPNIGAVAIGVPGAVTTDGEVFAIPQIPQWEHFPLREELEQKLQIPVVVSNDINSITVGYLASQEQIQNLIYIHMKDAAIGAGIIIDGKLYPGCGSFAGELGYIKTGHQNVEECMAENMKKSPAENKVETANLLSQILINVICILNPEKILLGGENLKEYLPQIRECCQMALPPYVIPPIDILKQEQTYYLNGLGRLGLQLLNQDIQIVRRYV